MELNEKTLASELAFDGVLLKLYRDQVELSDGGTSIREVVHHPGGAAVVALDGAGNVYLERQFRYPYRKVVVEIPAGKLEPGEEPARAIRRELKEEIGAEAARWDALGHVMPSVGYTDEMLYLFLARGLTFGERSLDQDEFLEPFKLPFAQALEMAADGRINDAKTVAALFRADRLMRKEREDGNG
jgi:ADP-ribose pyrophosphatase